MERATLYLPHKPTAQNSPVRYPCRKLTRLWGIHEKESMPPFEGDENPYWVRPIQLPGTTCGDPIVFRVEFT